jgi:hypothetical protein
MLRLVGKIFLLIYIQCLSCYAQKTKVKVSAFDGIVIVGYVDQGGFSNFTGPNINLIYKQSKFIFGALPSLRYKQDNSTPKNSFVTPNLGLGFTYSYKMLAVQLPLYYNTKTATQNGSWHLGLGLGLRFNVLNSKNKNT